MSGWYAPVPCARCLSSSVSASRARTAASLGIDLGSSPLDAADPPSRHTPGEWLEHRPLLSVAFVALAGAFLVSTFVQAKEALVAPAVTTGATSTEERRAD